MTDMIIREARSEDAAALLDYLKLIGSETHYLTFGAEGLPLTVEEEMRFLVSLHESERAECFLALSPDGEILGNAMIQGYVRDRMKHTARIAISVRKAFWGRGIGSALMQHMIDFAGARHIELITLEVLSDNTRALSLYKKFGFVRFGHLENFYKIGTHRYAADYMKLDLRPAP